MARDQYASEPESSEPEEHRAEFTDPEQGRTDWLGSNQETGWELLGLLLATQSGWMLVVLVVLVVLGLFSAELFFLHAFIGFQATKLLLAPTDPAPSWWTVVEWISRAGFVVLGYIVFVQFQESVV